MPFYAQSFYFDKIINRPDEEPWLYIEEHQLGPENLFLAMFTKRKIKNVNFVINNTLQSWGKIKNILGIEVNVPKTTELWDNSSITIDNKRLNWASWINGGIRTLSDISEKNKITALGKNLI